MDNERRLKDHRNEYRKRKAREKSRELYWMKKQCDNELKNKTQPLTTDNYGTPEREELIFDLLMQRRLRQMQEEKG